MHEFLLKFHIAIVVYLTDNNLEKGVAASMINMLNK